MRSLAEPFARWHLDSVDPSGVIGSAIADEHVVGCVTYCAAELVAPGVIRHVEGTRFAIGEPFGADGHRCQAISQAFQRGGLKCPIEDDLNEQIWLKLIGNVAFNTVSAITGCTLAELGVLDSSRRLLRRLLEESAAVANGLGIRLPVSIDRRLEGGLAVGAHKPSTLQDLEGGKPLELDCLSGAVIELADQLAIDVPCTRTVHTCLQLIESRRRPTPDMTTSPIALGV
jgi:2-dehydropantoate 2-reductase